MHSTESHQYRDGQIWGSWIDLWKQPLTEMARLGCTAVNEGWLKAHVFYYYFYCLFLLQNRVHTLVQPFTFSQNQMLLLFPFFLFFVACESKESPAPRCGADSSQVTRHSGKGNKYTPKAALGCFASILLQRLRKGFHASPGWFVFQHSSLSQPTS